LAICSRAQLNGFAKSLLTYPQGIAEYSLRVPPFHVDMWYEITEEHTLVPTVCPNIGKYGLFRTNRLNWGKPQNPNEYLGLGGLCWSTTLNEMVEAAGVFGTSCTSPLRGRRHFIPAFNFCSCKIVEPRYAGSTPKLQALKQKSLPLGGFLF